ncbi:MAG: hypothetical protein A3K03_03590 [Bdellovibrionales bacterium RIFOXYD1_FULL_44_7]|nr:MAG: hypothetical protein A3K03_03590 [Bdellovibrionales bacterium RIFOXYD1_FULL_44_7]
MIIDLHNDVPTKSFADQVSLFNEPFPAHIDLDKIKISGVNVLFFAAYSNSNFHGQEAFDIIIHQLDSLKKDLSRRGSPIKIALTSGDIDQITEKGEIAAVLCVEGGYSITDSFNVLDRYYEQGVRVFTLTHNRSTSWAGSDSDEGKFGLNKFGEKLIKHLNEAGIIIDTAHASTETIVSAAKTSADPIMYTHGGARALAKQSRSIDDRAIKAIADKGGVIGISFFPPHLLPPGQSGGDWMKGFGSRADILNNPSLTHLEKFVKITQMVNPDLPKPDVLPGIEAVFDNIDHIVNLVGDDFVALGSDFDGIPFTCVGLEDLSKYPKLVDLMKREGYSETRIDKILAKNAKRVIDSVL